MTGLGHRRGGGRRAREGARVLEDGRLPARLDPAGIAAIQQLGTAERLRRRRDRGRRAVHRRQPRPVRRRRVPVDDRRRPQRHPAGGVRALHPRRRRLRRHPRRGRHRVRLALVRQHARRATSATTRPERRPRRSTSRTRTSPSTQGLPARWTRTDEWYNYQGPIDPAVNGNTAVADFSRAPEQRPRPRHRRRVDLRRGRRQHHRRRPPDLVVLGLRRRPHLVHGHGPHAGVLLRRADFLKHILGGLRDRGAQRQAATAATPAPGPAADERLREGHARRRHAEPDGARRRATTAASSTSSATGACRSGARPRADGHRRHGPGHAAARRTACSASQLAPDFDDQPLGLPLLLARCRTPTGHQIVSRFKVNGDSLDTAPSSRSSPSAPDARVLPLVRLAVLRRRRQPLHLDGRQHEPVRLRRLRPDRRAARPRVLGRPAHGGQHERPQRQDPAHQAAGRTRPARPASARRTRSRPATSSRPGHGERRGPRSTAWASATRSGSPSTRRPAGS